ncbi:hypothetical protein PENSPDRAFT_219464 [Peniophora sp. CONT]|nr:hypothetical protein PENSPDRAFT_219464 [Peniophora sp. CONT]
MPRTSTAASAGRKRWSCPWSGAHSRSYTTLDLVMLGLGTRTAREARRAGPTRFPHSQSCNEGGFRMLPLATTQVERIWPEKG